MADDTPARPRTEGALPDEIITDGDLVLLHLHGRLDRIDGTLDDIARRLGRLTTEAEQVVARLRGNDR